MLKHNNNSITITQDEEFFDRLANSPLVLKKAEEAKAFLAKVGLPAHEDKLVSKTTKKQNGKTARKPRSGKEIKIKSKKVTKLSATKELAGKVNK